jgi:hypothetical protein
MIGCVFCNNMDSWQQLAVWLSVESLIDKWDASSSPKLYRELSRHLRYVSTLVLVAKNAETCSSW